MLTKKKEQVVDALSTHIYKDLVEQNKKLSDAEKVRLFSNIASMLNTEAQRLK